jgi:hypothetical protein
MESLRGPRICRGLAHDEYWREPPAGRQKRFMYPISIAILMVLGPAASVVLGLRHSPDAPIALLVLHWAVIWMVGGRLFLAGMRQVLQPRYTAETILGIGHADSLLVVRELGFANLALGAIGLGTILWPQWAQAAATGGAIYYGLAALNHLRAGQHTSFARIAMGALAVLSGCGIAAHYTS